MSTIRVNSIQHAGAANASIELSSNGRVTFSNTVAFTSNVGIGTTTNINRLTVSGPMLVPSPALGAANGTAIFTNSDTNYGTMFGSSGNGDGWIQQQRVDGTATAYNLLLNPVGGNVGIGTTSPGAKLNVRGGRSYFEASNEPYSVYVAHNASTSGAFLGGTSTGGFQLSAAGGGAWLNVDSSGRVTTPFQPVFGAFGSGTQSWSGGAAYQVLQLNSLVTSNNSRNSNYSTSTYRFTAPIAGMYMFFGKITATGAFTGPQMYLFINGGAVGHELAIGYSVAYMSTSGMIPWYMNAGDFADLRVVNNNNVSMTLDLGRCHFVGWLLG